MAERSGGVIPGEETAHERHFHSLLPERRWSLASSPREQVTGQEGMALSCTRGGSGWPSGRLY